MLAVQPWESYFTSLNLHLTIKRTHSPLFSFGGGGAGDQPQSIVHAQQVRPSPNRTIYQFNRYILPTTYVPGTSLGAKDTLGSKADMVLVPALSIEWKLKI
jgi:hypothetical protein